MSVKVRGLGWILGEGVLCQRVYSVLARSLLIIFKGELLVKIKLFLCVLLLVGSNIAMAQGGSTAGAAIADAPACDCPEPKDPEDWGTALSLGLTLTDGNSNTLLGTAAIAASREVDGEAWDFRLAGAYGENEVTSTSTDAEGNVTSTTSDDQTIGEVVGLAKYGKGISADGRLYTGAQVDFLHDAIQDIQYRVTLGLPIGYKVIPDGDFRLNVEVGPAYVFKRISHESDDNWAWFASQRGEWDISSNAKFFEQVTYNGSFESSDDYFVVAEAGLEAAVSSNMSLVLSVRDDYINIVGADKERNDLAVISSLKVAL